MSTQLRPAKVGMVLGTVMAGYHLAWSALVALRWAQPVIDFLFWAHFIRPVYVVEPFEWSRAAILFVVTGGIGFLIGALFAWMWNLFHRA